MVVTIATMREISLLMGTGKRLFYGTACRAALKWTRPPDLRTCFLWAARNCSLHRANTVSPRRMVVTTLRAISLQMAIYGTVVVC